MAAPAVESPRIRDVLRDIAWFRRRIREADAMDPQGAHALRASYGPFLERRLQLLAALREGRATAWREFPASGTAAIPRR